MRRFRPLLIFSVSLILIIALSGWLLTAYKAPRIPITPGDVPNEHETETFLGHLQFLWERYLEMVQLLITILTGVLVVSAGIVKFGADEHVVDRKLFSFGLASLLIGLACAVLWRIDSELLMEIEMFGDPPKVQKLYSFHGVPDPFTSSFNYAPHIYFFSHLARTFMVGTAVGLILGLTFLSCFAYSNLPQADVPPKASTD
jgi:hypothetical protein